MTQRNFSKTLNNSKQINPMLTRRRSTARTTLSKCMQEFNTLEKLSNFLSLEQKHNEKYLLNRAQEDASRTVLLDILEHRFGFLSNLKKKIKNCIFKSLLGCDEIYSYSKLKIHEYIRFLQLFVYRDASTHELSFFIFNFLFREQEEVSYQNAKKMLNFLGGDSSKHLQIQTTLLEIIQKCEGD